MHQREIPVRAFLESLSYTKGKLEFFCLSFCLSCSTLLRHTQLRAAPATAQLLSFTCVYRHSNICTLWKLWSFSLFKSVSLCLASQTQHFSLHLPEITFLSLFELLHCELWYLFQIATTSMFISQTGILQRVLCVPTTFFCFHFCFQNTAVIVGHADNILAFL